MDNSKLYEDIMLNRYFNRLKSVRNQWDNLKENQNIVHCLDVCDDDCKMFEFVMEESRKLTYEMLGVIVGQLLNKYHIYGKKYQVKRDKAYFYLVAENKVWPEHISQGRDYEEILYSIDDVLYVFKEYGLNNRMPRSLTDVILKENHLKDCLYVSLVEDNAFLEVLSYNEDDKDLSRGTGVISLKIFFGRFFGIEEYKMFMKYAEIFINNVNNYYGLKIIKTLKMNVMHNYRKNVREELVKFKLSDSDKEGRVSETQRELLDKNFYETGNLEVLLGESDFARSYMTAEWLYSSLNNSGNIDQTVVAMGYFKGIEQLLFQFLKLHTLEKDDIQRDVYVGKQQAYADEKGNILLVDELVNNPETAEKLTLGSLTGFFGYYDAKHRKYHKRNQDLLIPGIEDKTYEYIVEVFTNVVGLRNRYFHRDNLEDWDKVEEARKTAQTVFYLLLGAYKFNNIDKETLGCIPREKHDDFYLLCEYMNQKAFDVKNSRIPVFYLNGEKNPFSYWEVYRDDFITYDYYDEPVYSGVYFIENEHYIKRATRQNMPTEIWEGVFDIGRMTPLDTKPSGPIRKIYENGKFLVQ